MGPFKMIGTVLRNLVRGPVTRRYPAVPARMTPVTRGHVAIDPATCRSCGICSKRCPCVAIRIDKEEKIWEIDRMRCIACGDCVESCPFGSLTMEQEYLPPTVEHVVDRYTITYVKPERKPKAKEEGAADA
ncbi:MAG: 4Fe-4S dicluster domain-containing protein [Methanomicrobiales archaeon]|nr:4Fe-4S dicluster domain-containing protein [Methanomicrobiales archaeon]